MPSNIRLGDVRIETPVLQVDVNERGEITKVWGDLKLYEAAIALIKAPALAAVLETEDWAQLLPTGERVVGESSIDEQPDLWLVSRYGPAAVSLKQRWPGLGIDLKIKKLAPPADLAPAEVEATVEFARDPEVYEALIEGLAGQEGYRRCLVNLTDSTDNPPGLCHVREFLRLARDLRMVKNTLFDFVRRNPLTEEGEDEP